MLTAVFNASWLEGLPPGFVALYTVRNKKNATNSQVTATGTSCNLFLYSLLMSGPGWQHHARI